MKKVLVSAIYFIPAIALAQNLGNLNNLVVSLRGIVDILIPLAFAIALLFFFWGLALYILNAGNEEKREQGKNIMIWGIVALFIMASIWGIVAFIGSALGIGQGQDIGNVPGVGN